MATPDDMAERLATDLSAAPFALFASPPALAEHLAALGWRKAGDGGPIQQDVEAMTLDFVSRNDVDTVAAFRRGLREAVSVADAMAMDAIRGLRVTKAQDAFGEAAKRVADAIWALRERIGQL